LAILNFKFSNSYNFCACVLLPQARLEAAEKYQEFATKAKNLLQASSKQVIDLLKRLFFVKLVRMVNNFNHC
jgi:hypothetical protein